jgi:hypothetical protein
LQPGARQALLAIAPYGGEHQITKRGVGEAVIDGGLYRQLHLCRVDLVGTRIRDVDDVQRQARQTRLHLQDIAPYAVHRHTIDPLVDRGQEAGHSSRMCLVERMQHPRAVLARAPGEEDLHWKASG